MAVTDTAPAKAQTISHAHRRQPLVIGWLLWAPAGLVAACFAMPPTGPACVRLAFPGDLFTVPNLKVPAAPYAWIVAAVLAFFGVRQFLPGAAKWSGILFGIGLLLVVTAFLTWATAGKSF